MFQKTLLESPQCHAPYACPSHVIRPYQGKPMGSHDTWGTTNSNLKFIQFKLYQVTSTDAVTNCPRESKTIHVDTA